MHSLLSRRHRFSGTGVFRLSVPFPLKVCRDTTKCRCQNQKHFQVQGKLYKEIKKVLKSCKMCSIYSYSRCVIDLRLRRRLKSSIWINNFFKAVALRLIKKLF